MLLYVIRHGKGERRTRDERNRLFTTLILDTGPRLAEVINLRRQDLDLRTGSLMIRKRRGANNRIVRLCSDVIELVRSWRERQADRIGAEAEHVFATLKGKPLQPRYLQAMVRRYGVRAGIEKHVHPCLLRHTCAMAFYRETHNVRDLQANLGHSDLTTTSIYRRCSRGARGSAQILSPSGRDEA